MLNAKIIIDNRVTERIIEFNYLERNLLQINNYVIITYEAIKNTRAGKVQTKPSSLTLKLIKMSERWRSIT